MSLPLNTQGMDSVLRLANLKNVSGRRRVRNEAPLLPEEPEIDVSGTAPPMIAPNIPEADLGGELTPQSYDVRANEIVDPNAPPPPQEIPEEEKGLFRRLGSSLLSYFSENPYSEDSEEVLDRQTPVLPRSVQQPPKNNQEKSFSKLGRYLTSPQGLPTPQETLSPEQEYEEKIRKFSEGYIPEESTPYSPTYQATQEERNKIEVQRLKDEIEKGQENPVQEAVYGSTDQFIKNPELVSKFNQYTGLNFSEKEAEITKKFEKVLSDMENNLNEINEGYDEQELRIKDRILNNQATEADKFYIGLALLMPMIIGGLFGKEVGIGALGGSFKGLASAFSDRQKNILADEELLAQLRKDKSQIGLKKSEIELERAKLPEAIKKMIPEDERADLKGMNIYEFKDPDTGEVVAQGPEVLPGIYANLNVYNTPEKRKEAFKSAQEIGKEKSALDTADKAMVKLIEAAYQLDDPTWFGDILSYGLAKNESGPLKLALTKNSPEIYADGRKQNAAIYIDSLIEQIKDGYRRNEQMKAFTNTVAEHISSMIRNPIYAGFRPRDLIDQVLLLRDRGMGFFTERLKSQGFLDAPIRSEFGSRGRAIYDAMNIAEQKKKVPLIKQEAIKYSAENEPTNIPEPKQEKPWWKPVRTKIRPQ